MKETAKSFTSHTNEVHEGRLYDILSANLRTLMEESRDQHRCPDLTSSADAIVTSLVPVCSNHPVLQDAFSPPLFRNLISNIRQKLDEVIGTKGFVQENQRAFMLHVWSGHLANDVLNKFLD